MWRSTGIEKVNCVRNQQKGEDQWKKLTLSIIMLLALFLFSSSGFALLADEGGGDAGLEVAVRKDVDVVHRNAYNYGILWRC